jgi:hypothetical protein
VAVRLGGIRATGGGVVGSPEGTRSVIGEIAVGHQGKAEDDDMVSSSA